MIILGIDDGNYSCKAFGRVANEIKTFSVPSLVRKGAFTSRSVLEGMSVNSSQSNLTSTFAIDGSIYSTGDVKSDSKRANERGYCASEENLAVVSNVLHQLGLSGDEVSLMTGMPFQYFYKPNGEVNKAFVEQKKATFKKSVHNVNNNSSVNIGKHAVMAQGEAAYYDLLIDINTERSSKGLVKNGVTDKEILESNVLIWDIGGGTTDPVYIKRGGIVDHQRSGTFEHGGYKVISELEDLIKQELSLSIELGRDRYQDALLTGNLRINNKRNHDVMHIVEPLIQRHFEIILEKTKGIVNGFDDIDVIAPIGGTSHFFKEIMEKTITQNELRFPEDPIMSNARGMFKRMYLLSSAKK